MGAGNIPAGVSARMIAAADQDFRNLRPAAAAPIALGDIVAVSHLLGVELGEVVSVGPNDPRITVRFSDRTQSAHHRSDVRLATFDEAEAAGYDGTGR